MSNIIQPPQDGKDGRRELEKVAPMQAGSETFCFRLHGDEYRLGCRPSAEGTEYFAERNEGGRWLSLMPRQFNHLEQSLLDEMKMMRHMHTSRGLVFEGSSEDYPSRLTSFLDLHSKDIHKALAQRPEAKDSRNTAGPMMQAGLSLALREIGFDPDVSGIIRAVDQSTAQEWLELTARQYPKDTMMFGASVSVLTAVQDYTRVRLKDHQNPPSMEEIATWLKDTKKAEETIKREKNK